MTDQRPALDRFQNVTVVAAGVIGASWAALFLAMLLQSFELRTTYSSST